MSDIAGKLRHYRAAVLECEKRYGRPAHSVGLVAVTKMQPARAIRDAWTGGQRVFGENYVAEALAKQAELSDLAIEWHFIGAIQSNKTKDIARAFTWVHTLDRAKIAERLNAQRPAEAAPLNALIQVNISGEASKGGVAPAELPGLLDQIADLPRIRLRGLMAMPAPVEDEQLQRAAFARVAALARDCRLPLDTLSMGTTHDFEAAIAEGATLIRLGTAIFGPRPERP